MTRKLVEATGLAPATGDGRWRIRLIKEGVSKNGYNYLGRVLNDDGATAWPAGTRMMANHDVEAPYTGGNIKDVIGFTTTDPEYVEGDGLWADVQIGSEWKQFVEDYHKTIGLSVVVQADVEDTGFGPTVTKLYPDEYNSVDIVLAPSAGGMFSKQLTEAYKKITGHEYVQENVVSETTDNEGEDMDEAKIKALFESLTTALEARFAGIETKLDTTIKLAESAVAAAPTADEAFEAGVVASTEGLSEGAVKRVKAAAEKGISLHEAVQSEVDIRKEYLAEGEKKVVVEGHVHDNDNKKGLSLSEILAGKKESN